MADEADLPFVTVKERPYVIPEDLAHELAAIVIEWSGLENAITADLETMRMWPVVRALSDVVPGGFGARLKLWRRSIAALYPTIKTYNDIAASLAEAAHATAVHRHRLIHGLWQPNDAEPGSFDVLTPIERLRKDPAVFAADVKYLSAIHADIKNISLKIWGFTLNRQLHVFGGLLELQPVSSGEHPAPPTPPTPEKP